MVEALFDDNANAEAKRDKPTLYAMQFHDWKDPTLIWEIACGVLSGENRIHSNEKKSRVSGTYFTNRSQK